MAKLLIIDCNTENVQNIQRQFQNINSFFTKDSTFCFVSALEDNAFSLEPLSNIMFNNILTKTDFYGRRNLVLDMLKKFILTFNNEEILIVINTILISSNNVIPTQNCALRQEYSWWLYYNLIKLANGYDANVTCNNVYSLMYSPSSNSPSAISQQLNNLYVSCENQYFPEECCETKNISWVKSLHKGDYNSTINSLELPTSYEDFISELQ